MYACGNGRAFHRADIFRVEFVASSLLDILLFLVLYVDCLGDVMPSKV